MTNEKFEVYNAQTTISRVSNVSIGFCPIVRIPIHSQQEADEYMRRGVAIYEKRTQNAHGERCYYFIEVEIYELAKVAKKA